MAKAPGNGEKDKGLSNEIAGIVLLALALYIGVSVFSPLGGEQWGGVAGSFISGIATTAVGYASYIIPLFLLVTGFKLLLRRALAISVLAPISIFIFMVAASGLMDTVGGGMAGGAVGEAITRTLTRYAGRAGSLAVLVGLIVLSVLAFSGISRKKGTKAPEDAAPAPPEYEDYDIDDDEEDEGDEYGDNRD